MKIYKCEHCLFQTLHKRVFQTHMKARHEQDASNALTCEHCGFQSMYASSMARHIKTKHADNTPTVAARSDIPPQSEPEQVYEHPNANNGTTNQSNHNTIHGDHATIVQNINHYNIQLVMPFPLGPIDTIRPRILTETEYKEKLIRFIMSRNLTSAEDIKEAITMFYDDPTRIPIRKDASNSGKTHIHIGNGEWKTEPDKKVYPKLVLQTAADVASVLNDEVTEKPHGERIRAKLEKNADTMGDFYDNMEHMILLNEGVYIRPKTEEEQRSKFAYKQSEECLKEKAKEAFVQLGNPTSRRHRVRRN